MNNFTSLQETANLAIRLFDSLRMMPPTGNTYHALRERYFNVLDKILGIKFRMKDKFGVIAGVRWTYAGTKILIIWNDGKGIQEEYASPEVFEYLSRFIVK